MKINNYREQIEYNNRQIRQREGNNELIRKNYNDFQKQIALKKDRLT